MSQLPDIVTKRVRELEAEDPTALVAVFDPFGYYLYASPHHRPVLGYTPRELLEINLAQVVERADHNAVFMLRTIVTIYTKPVTFSAHLLTKKGERVKLSGHLYHIRHEGERYFLTSTKPEPETQLPA
jgi:PAS domain S-box-containing protein